MVGSKKKNNEKDASFSTRLAGDSKATGGISVPAMAHFEVTVLDVWRELGAEFLLMFFFKLEILISF